MAVRPCVRNRYVNRAILLALPLLLLGLNPNWIYTPVGTIDPWVYYGFFYNLKQYLVEFFPNTYYGSRLPLILPGYVAHKLFSPAVATVLLHLFYYYMAVFSLYFTLACCVNRRTALLTAVMFGCHRFFLDAVGWDYTDGPAVAYYLLAFALLTLAARGKQPLTLPSPPKGEGTQHRRLFLALSGVAFTAAFYINVTWAMFFPSLPLFFLVMTRGERAPSPGAEAPPSPHGGEGNGTDPSSATGVPLLGPLWEIFSIRRIITFTLCFGIGVLAISTLLGAINYGIGGSFLFYKPSIDTFIALMKVKNPWKNPDYTWVPNASWLVFPVLAFCASVFLLLRACIRGRTRVRLAAYFMALNCIACSLLMLYWEMKGTPVLQVSYYAAYLLPAAFLALGSCLACVPARFRPKWFYALLAGVVAAFALPIAGVAFPQPLLFSVLATAGIGAISIALKAALPSSRLALIGCLLCLGFVHWRVGMWGKPVTWDSRSERRDQHVRITRSMKAIDATFDATTQGVKPPRRPPRFWYDLKEPLGHEFMAISSAYLWGYTLVNMEFPMPMPSEKQPGSPITAGMLIVVPSAKFNVLDRIQQGLGQADLRARLLSTVAIEEGGESYSLTFIEVEQPPPNWQRPVMITVDGLMKACASKSDANFPLDQWEQSFPKSQMRAVMQEDGLHVTTTPKQWAYATMYSPLTVPADGTYHFEMKYVLLDGGVLFGALSEDKSTWLKQAGPPARDGERLVKFFSLDLKAGEKVWLMTINDHPDHASDAAGEHPSSYIITELRVYCDKPPAAAGANP